MSGRLRVKICGLTREADVHQAVTLGADALGFIFWPRSPRYVDADRARALVQAVPPLVNRVGVFVDATPRDVAAIVAHVGLDVVQLHGDEAIEAFSTVGARLIKVVGLDDDGSVAQAGGLPSTVLPLVDATDRERRGGTGQRANWTRAAELARMRPMVLAGGLTAATVAEAMRVVRPWAIDVSSGVEDAPGVKSAVKLEALFAAVDAARSEGM